MPQLVRGALIQATLSEPGDAPVGVIKQSMIDKHVDLIAQAARTGCADLLLARTLLWTLLLCRTG